MLFLMVSLHRGGRDLARVVDGDRSHAPCQGSFESKTTELVASRQPPPIGAYEKQWPSGRQSVTRAISALFSRRSGCRSTHDELGRDHGSGQSPLAFHAVEQHLQAAAPELAEVLPHGGERGREVRRFGDVVEAHDAEVTWHFTTRFVQPAEESERHLIVGDEHCRKLAGLEQRLPELVAGARGPV